MSTDREIVSAGCYWPSAAVISKSFLGQHTYDEYWLIKTVSLKIIYLYFDDFDIGCSWTYIQIGKVKYCNTNRPFDKLTDIEFRIEYHIKKAHGRSLVEGFSARYGVKEHTSVAASNSVVEGIFFIVQIILLFSLKSLSLFYLL